VAELERHHSDTRCRKLIRAVGKIHVKLEQPSVAGPQNRRAGGQKDRAECAGLPSGYRPAYSGERPSLRKRL